MRNTKIGPLALGAALLAFAAGPLTAGEASTMAAEKATSGFTEDLVADFERAGEKLLSLAEAIPADKYSWSPADGVRNVGEVYMHIVGTNVLLPMGLGAAPPEGMKPPENPFELMQEWEKTVTAKDEVVDRLRDSIEYAKQAIPQIQDLDAEADLFGFPASKRAYLLIAVTHAHEHLGQSIAYARSIGVVPPWSAAAQEAASETEGEAEAEAETEAEAPER